AAAGGRTARLSEAEARDSLDESLLAQHNGARRLAEAGQIALNGVVGALDSLAADLIAGSTGGAQPDADFLGGQAMQALDDFAQLMNSGVGRDFVFAGETASIPPIDLAALDALKGAIAAYVPTAAPSLNDQFDAFIAANPGLLDAVLAGSATPRAAVSGPLGEIAPDALTLDRLNTRDALTAVTRTIFVTTNAAGAPTAAEDLQASAAALKTAVDGQVNGQAQLGAFEARLDRSEAFIETRRNLLQDDLREALVADPFETSVELFQAQSQLEASIDALARILSLDISDRLR
ncbi:MAG: hypothetical protein AAF899_11735, partial [Pseudomonadota bacterium]